MKPKHYLVTWEEKTTWQTIVTANNKRDAEMFAMDDIGQETAEQTDTNEVIDGSIKVEQVFKKDTEQ